MFASDASRAQVFQTPPRAPRRLPLAIGQNVPPISPGPIFPTAACRTLIPGRHAADRLPKRQKQPNVTGHAPFPQCKFVEGWVLRIVGVQDRKDKGACVVKLNVRDRESIQEAVRRFRKLVERSGIKKEMRRREYYEKPSETRRRARLRAARRGRANLLSGK